MRKSVPILGLLLLLSLLACVRFSTFEANAPDSTEPTKIYGIKMLWNTSMTVNDVAVSKDGNYIAVVNDTGLYYFAYDYSTPKWWYLSEIVFRSVAISADGEYVIVGDNTGYIYYFNNSRAVVAERPSPTWQSINLFGQIERGTLDISSEGEYVVIVGTGSWMYYFANCTTRSSAGENTTWRKMFDVAYCHTVDMSPDGSCIAAGGSTYSLGGFVVFYNDANAMPYPTEGIWFSSGSMNSSVIDLAVSDDGYAVTAIDQATVGTLYYWANATSLSGDPNATWTNAGGFSSVDMSADGDNVVAGGDSPQIVYFWSNAREQEGTQEADWVRYQAPQNADDVVMSDDGGIIAATTESAAPYYKAYFLKSDGTMIDEFDLIQQSPLASMSGNGRITAIAGPGWDSLYVFEILEEVTPPMIKDMYQVPSEDNVQPENEVMVYANVTDELSGVKGVILNYTYTNSSGSWSKSVNMTQLPNNIYNGTIQKLPYCTNVTYVIIAEDNFNNTITTEELGFEFKYHVIPELQSWLILPLFMTATLLAVIFHRRKHFKH